MNAISHFVNGQRQSGEGSLPIFNPATGETCADVPVPEPAVVSEVIAGARTAWATW
jgi:malonate-semialdehyde dehydrogenase (acetylating) / methylmalonate-semialdehyde dehydrogenase